MRAGDNGREQIVLFVSSTVAVSINRRSKQYEDEYNELGCKWNIFEHFSAVWIQEEKELLQEVSGMGELREPWHSRQVELLDRHLQLLHLYSQAKEHLQAHKGKITFLARQFQFIIPDYWNRRVLQTEC